jgi:hypothetical protein
VDVEGALARKGSFCKPCAENGKTKKINDKSNAARKESGKLQVDNAKSNDNGSVSSSDNGSVSSSMPS